jgi:hypothetical protein
MATEVLGVLFIIIATVSLFIMIIYLRKFQNIERMAMIEKGVGAELFAKNGDPSWALRFAFLLIGAGSGLLFGYFLDELFNMKEVAYFSMVLIFGGLGLVSAYLFEERKNLKKKS